MTDTPSTAEASHFAAIHAATLTLDTHVDVAWPSMADPATRTGRRVDFPKMREGGLKAVVFIAYVPQGPLSEAGHAAAGARAEAMLQAIAATAGAEPMRRRLCTTPDALEACHAAGELGVLLGVENGYAMGEDLSRLARWRELGAIYLTLTHDGHNALSDSARPRADLGDMPSRHGGLSQLGRAAIAEMNRIGLIVDVSHVARSGMMQAAELSRTPIVATHTCCRALRDHPRNLDDEQLEMLRAVGGLAQITAVPSFLCKPGPDGTTRATLSDYADHVDHAVRRIGIDHVGLSSDFDGGGGFTGWEDASKTAAVSAELLRRGYGPRELTLLWSGNFLRVWRAALRAAG
ncbi:dipeptidase [Falsiroseomonas selenitidurans]|uniref:Membrane dipeptidase n=1 Tax=Falsiroseomonas selenitidurans TaxID=2716335 RepID=A0ABX1E2L4_9PROT|nr:membrane dipeptidase [Falsiroseomonas selenitidurans]NKC30930.1 membrane dipeptidase [Falsiroseomonas selenitidurans]